MIEVEKKFVLNEENKKRVIAGARFLKEIKFRDVYYDTADWKFTKDDIWLRTRNNKFELKVAAVAKEDNQETNFYHELDAEEEIRKRLDIGKSRIISKRAIRGKHGSLAADLARAGFIVFSDCATARRKYQKGEFIIDLDTVAYADTNWRYRIGEIELLVKTKEETPRAFKKIAEFARGRGLAVTPVRGKVLEYLKRERPKHYEALMKAWKVDNHQWK